MAISCGREAELHDAMTALHGDQRFGQNNSKLVSVKSSLHNKPFITRPLTISAWDELLASDKRILASRRTAATILINIV